MSYNQRDRGGESEGREKKTESNFIPGDRWCYRIYQLHPLLVCLWADSAVYLIAFLHKKTRTLHWSTLSLTLTLTPVTYNRSHLLVATSIQRRKKTKDGQVADPALPAQVVTGTQVTWCKEGHDQPAIHCCIIPLLHPPLIWQRVWISWRKSAVLVTRWLPDLIWAPDTHTWACAEAGIPLPGPGTTAARSSGSRYDMLDDESESRKGWKSSQRSPGWHFPRSTCCKRLSCTVPRLQWCRCSLHHLPGSRVFRICRTIHLRWDSGSRPALHGPLTGKPQSHPPDQTGLSCFRKRTMLTLHFQIIFSGDSFHHFANTYGTCLIRLLTNFMNVSNRITVTEFVVAGIKKLN